MSIAGPLIPRHRTSKRKERWRPVVLAILSVVAVLFQVYVPLLYTYLSYVELPLLFTIHFALARRSPLAALAYGAAIGLLQDAFSSRPLGVYGIVNTLIGFFAANAGLRMDADNPAIRFLLSFVFFFIHQGFLLVLTRALLGEATPFDPWTTAGVGLLNAAVAVPLFQLLDRL